MVNLKIRDLREDSDLYQRHLADYLKVTQQTYSRYETGELWPSLITMAKLAEYYNTRGCLQTRSIHNFTQKSQSSSLNFLAIPQVCLRKFALNLALFVQNFKMTEFANTL